MRAVFATAVTALVSVSLYGCGSDTTTTPAAPACQTIPELAAGQADLSTLVTLLTQQNLTDTLAGTGPFTVFAPTNAAFAAITDVTDALTPEQLTDVLLYHVVGAHATAADLTLDESLASLFTPHMLTVATLTPSVTIRPDSNGTDATVTQADIMACNDGVVHIVDAVLVPDLGAPPAPAPSPSPTPAPPAPGPGPANVSTTAGPAPAPAPLPSIVELAQNTPDLSTLVSLLIQHNLTDALSGSGPFTVFAPTNAAFDAISEVTADLTPEELTNVLLYHVVGAEALAADLTLDESLASLFTPHMLTVATLEPTVTIRPDSDAGDDAHDATVTAADNMASNGVVHIVDAVLVPMLASFKAIVA